MTFRKLFVLAALSAACSSAPTNFAGTYSLTTTENANACNFPNWTPGSSSSGIPATFTQDGTTAQLNIQGAWGVIINAYVGTSSFQGSVSGNTFTSEYLGSKSAAQGACTYTANISISSSLDGNNVLSGTLTITPVTNKDPSCGVLDTCSNNETVSGARTGP